MPFLSVALAITIGHKNQTDDIIDPNLPTDEYNYVLSVLNAADPVTRPAIMTDGDTVNPYHPTIILDSNGNFHVSHWASLDSTQFTLLTRRIRVF